MVLDSWAWLELFAGSKQGKKVDQLMSAAESFTSTVSLAEVVSVSARRGRPTEDKVLVIRSQSRVVPPSSDDAIEAGLIHAAMRKGVDNFSLADSFVLQLARKKEAKVLTGDPDFRQVKEAELLG